MRSEPGVKRDLIPLSSAVVAVVGGSKALRLAHHDLSRLLLEQSNLTWIYHSPKLSLHLLSHCGSSISLLMVCQLPRLRPRLPSRSLTRSLLLYQLIRCLKGHNRPYLQTPAPCINNCHISASRRESAIPHNLSECRFRKSLLSIRFRSFEIHAHCLWHSRFSHRTLRLSLSVSALLSLSG